VLYPLSYTGTIPVAGFEPATTCVSSEVTLVFTTGRIRFVNNETHPEVRRLGFRFAVAWIPLYADTSARAHNCKSGQGTCGHGVLCTRGFEPRRPERTPAPEVAVAFTTDPLKLSWGNMRQRR
jgi:hypothetical protein